MLSSYGVVFDSSTFHILTLIDIPSVKQEGSPHPLFVLLRSQRRDLCPLREDKTSRGIGDALLRRFTISDRTFADFAFGKEL